MLILVAVTNDVTGARILIIFFVMGLIANLSLIRPEEQKNIPEQKKKEPVRVLYARR